MMPQEPAPWIIRGAAWVLLSAFAFGLLLAIVMRLPETVQCPFILVPSSGSDPIQAAHAGVISRVSVTEGQTLKKGDELFVLRSDEIHTLDTELRTLSEDLRIKQDGLSRTEAAYHSQLNIKLAEIEQAKSEVKFRENHAKTSKELVSRMERLAGQGGVSEVEMIKLKLDAAGSEKDLSVAQRRQGRIGCTVRDRGRHHQPEGAA